MAEYDAMIIEEFADRLYTKAFGIQIWMTIVGTLAGLFLGWVFINVRSGVRIDPGSQNLIQFVALVLGGASGLAIGRGLAFKYKLQAQTALCQVQIEKNTRTKSEAATAGR